MFLHHVAPLFLLALQCLLLLFQLLQTVVLSFAPIFKLLSALGLQAFKNLGSGCPSLPSNEEASLSQQLITLVLGEQTAPNVALEFEVDQVRFESRVGLLPKRILLHSVEGFGLNTELPKLVGVEHSIDLAFDLGEDKLVFCHHVEGFSLQNCFLMVLHKSLFSDF